MAFNSFTFLAIFLPLVAGTMVILPARYRAVFLLAASYVFCLTWSVQSAALLFLSSAADFVIGISMRSPKWRTPLLALSIALNIGLLGFFKYADFFLESASAVLAFGNLPVEFGALSLILPLGISYYTFKKLSYIIDIYRRKRLPETNPVSFLLYTSFFPSLIAGPIDRSEALLPQLSSIGTPRMDQVIAGFSRIAWGIAKKMIVANHAAAVVSVVYQNPSAQTPLALLAATYLFSVQIYADFSGYSDMAIGAAQVLGIRLSENFRRPYEAVSISDFWRRWHITLSSWFRDYVYIPLGGNRVSPWRFCLNLLITFLLSGLWHGAGWTFVVWGGIHGGYLIIGHLTRDLRSAIVQRTRLNRYPRLHQALQVGIVFHLITFAWIFFRAHSLTDAMIIIRGIGRGVADMAYGVLAVSPQTIIFIGLAGMLMLLAEHFLRDRDIGTFVLGRSTWQRFAFGYVLLLAVLIFGHFDYQPFIYAQF